MKLDSTTRHLLRLVAAGVEEDEDKMWAKVSSIVMVLVKELPTELVIVETFDDGSGRVRLTDEGIIVVRWL